MTWALEVDNLRDGYVRIGQAILHHGQRVAPRGHRTSELEDVVITLTNPMDSLPVGVGRQVNLAIAAAEAVQLIGAFSSPKLMLSISRNFGDYMDDDRFWGAYGNRIGRQLVAVERKLKDDRSSRQAVITLWDPRLDNRPGMRDYPCTVSLRFTIRDDKLRMRTTMRSNDFWLGLAYDAFMFTQLQLTLASALGVEPGAYVHYADSLHVYDRDAAKVEGLQAAEQLAPHLNPSGFTGTSVLNAMTRARAVAFGAYATELTYSERWYLGQLRPYLRPEDEL